MPTDPRTIAENRKGNRDATAKSEDRQAVALEQIADTLEALRIDLVRWMSISPSNPHG
jgi:hypothetical protein